MDRILTDLGPQTSRCVDKKGAFSPCFSRFRATEPDGEKNLKKVAGNALSGSFPSGKTGDFQSRQIIVRLIAVLQGAQLWVGNPQHFHWNVERGNAVKEKCRTQLIRGEKRFNLWQDRQTICRSERMKETLFHRHGSLMRTECRENLTNEVRRQQRYIATRGVNREVGRIAMAR